MPEPVRGAGPWAGCASGVDEPPLPSCLKPRTGHGPKARGVARACGLPVPGGPGASLGGFAEEDCVLSVRPRGQDPRRWAVPGPAPAGTWLFLTPKVILCPKPTEEVAIFLCQSPRPGQTLLRCSSFLRPGPGPAVPPRPPSGPGVKLLDACSAARWPFCGAGSREPAPRPLSRPAASLLGPPTPPCHSVKRSKLLGPHGQNLAEPDVLQEARVLHAVPWEGPELLAHEAVGRSPYSHP